MEHKDQHTVPRCYLKAWCDPSTPPRQTPYVWLFSKDDKVGRPKAPHNILTETDIYTIPGPDGARDLSIEKGLAEIERAFVDVRDNVLAKRAALSPDDTFALSAFIGAMCTRTVPMRDHWRKQWEDTLALGESMQRDLDNQGDSRRSRPVPSLPPNGPTMSLDDVRGLVENPMPRLLTMGLGELPNRLFLMDLAVAETDDELGFITSDHPAHWFDAEACKRPWPDDAPSLIYPTIEIRFPLSPRQMLILNRAGLNGYVPAPADLVDELNRGTRAHCGEFFVVSRDATKDVWFNMGIEPKDSWRQEMWRGRPGTDANGTLRYSGEPVGRNESCPCGSGKKYKRCHGA